MTKNPKVSVLMPVYNTKEEWLKEAIESILNQTFTDFEFIIINDGSSNNAKDVILSYKDKRIKYYEQENCGLIKTLNRGLKLCKGEYIARMDSDDISLPKRLEKEVAVLDKNENIGIVGCWINRFPSNNIIYLKERPRYLDLLKECQLAHPTVMIRSSVLKKYDFKYGDFLYAEDYELWSRFIKVSDLYNIQEVLLNYRVHESSITSSCAQVQAETSKKVQQNMLDYLTDDTQIQERIMDMLCPETFSDKLNFIEKIFSITNQKHFNTKKKILCILGMKFCLKTKKGS